MMLPHFVFISLTHSPFLFRTQGNKAEGIVHLEGVASLEEPEDPKSKAHYYDGLLLLARYEFELFIKKTSRTFS